ncbi:hypothetical protein AK812_SmicGene43612 [Symbiodinium microadriaticum]|uniref:Uncharacterized protein n=1 Tax=Symbiodinium microadriaticum TaxID=2951 RepID=A0A1Q9C0K3_SYMMI|nr:hypothetical protein AK812_SmicGene43612 [Symbiodinium microadriaticum]
MTGAVDHSFVQLGPAKANLSGVAKSMNESVEMKQRPFLPKAAPKRPQEVPEGHRMEQEPPPEAKAEIEVLMTRLMLGRRDAAEQPLRACPCSLRWSASSQNQSAGVGKVDSSLQVL